jgi:hypothetical protein
MLAWIVVIPFTPDAVDVGGLGLLVLLAGVAAGVGWTTVQRWWREGS